MKSIRAYGDLVKSYRFLLFVVILHLLAIVVVAAYMPFEARKLNNINVWIKPLKFLVSVVPYMLTLPGLLALLSFSEKKRHRFAGIISLSMLVENSCITMQASRGVYSHYNNSTPFNLIVSNIMAVFILVNTIYAALLFIAMLKVQQSAQHLVVAFRYALFLFLLASVGGGFMIAHNQHSVGAPDGAPGLFFTNWNRSGGDLRVMHFFGLHSLQILPLIAFFSRNHKRLLTVHLPGLLLSAFTIFVFIQALMGKPFPA